MARLHQIFIGLIVTTSLASSQEVLPDNFPEFSSQAWVQETEIAPDGSVFLMGNFTSVNGIARPGLAKLQPNGQLDPGFTPQEVDDINAIDEFGSYLVVGFDAPSNELFALSNGGLMRSNSLRFEIRNPDGSVNPEALTDLRGDKFSVRPQFERNGTLWIVRRSETEGARILARDSQTLAPRADKTASGPFPAPPVALAPAQDGKIWVLGQALASPLTTAGFGTSVRQVLFRLNSDGSLDDSFEAEELESNLRYRMERSQEMNLVISRFWPGRYLMWPQSSAQVRTFEFRDRDGAIDKMVTLRTAFGIQPGYTLQDGELYTLNTATTKVIQIAESNPVSVIDLDRSAMPLFTTRFDSDQEGRFLIGGLQRFLDNGQLDPTWQTPRLEAPTIIKRLLSLPDNQVLALGDFDLVSGARRLGAARLNSDGSFDSSFSCEVDLRQTSQICQKKNGNFLVLENQAVGLIEEPPPEIIELDSHGRVVGAVEIEFAGNIMDGGGNGFFSEEVSATFSLQPDDSIILQVTSGTEVPITRVWRIPSNDPDNPIPLRDSRGRNVFATALPDGRLLLGNELRDPQGLPIPGVPTLPLGSSYRSLLKDGTMILSRSDGTKTVLYQWRPDEGTIPGFETSDLRVLDIFNPLLDSSARNKFLLTNLQIPAIPTLNESVFGLNFGSSQVRRLHSDGSLDPTFEIVPNPEGNVFTFSSQNTDSENPTIWVAGSFTEINGVPRNGLAIVSDNQASGFQEWMRACAGIAPDIPTFYDENGDEDGDGLTNLFEYAAGSHPIQRLPLPQGLIGTSPTSWEISCNPEAPEIIRRLEVSDDLINWRPAQGNDLRINTGLDCFSWTLQSPKNSLFTRLKIAR